MTSPATHSTVPEPASPLTTRDRYVILIAAFLGWMFAGVQMANFTLANGAIVRDFRTDAVREAVQQMPEAELRAAAAVSIKSGKMAVPETFEPATAPSAQVIDLVTESRVRRLAGTWFGYYICSFLLGAALGGLIFGWLGDQIGRATAMGLSIVWYSAFIGLCYFGQTLEQLLILRFIACLGVGGMWPTGVALASEAWSNTSRPLLAGLIGTSANVGLALTGVLETFRTITAEDWRWVMAISAMPALLGLYALLYVPESPGWKAQRNRPSQVAQPTPIGTVFRPPYLWLTILGILLGTIPLLGGWGSSNWLISWSDQVGSEINDSTLKGRTMSVGSTGAAIGSLFGGYIASAWGRRKTYFAISLISLLLSGYIFWFVSPTNAYFLTLVFWLRLVSTTYFGWLPLYLPELFPTQIRATGSGVTFNFGRILSAVGVLGTSGLITLFHSDYARVGRITHLIFAVGMIVILFAPDTANRRMDE